MNKTISLKLINNERISHKVLSAKGCIINYDIGICTEQSNDQCDEKDYAGCWTYSNDYCKYIDSAACGNHSNDVCNSDYQACYAGANDQCNIDN